MKKLLCLFLAVVFLMTALPSYAQDDNMEKILLSVKERIPDTKNFNEFNSRINNSNGHTVYYFEWSNNSGETYTSLNITATESGIITSYHYYSSAYETSVSPSINSISYDEAIIAADEFLTKLNPAIAKEFKLEKMSQTENLFDNQFRFRVKRYINGLPVARNEGYISLDKNAKTLLSFNITYDENIKFQDISDIISKEQAISAYKTKLGLCLKYFNYYDKKEKTVYPAYIPSEDSNTYINALSGDKITLEYNEYYFGSAGELTNDKNMATMRDESLSAAEKEELSAIGGLLSESELERIIKSNKYLPFDNSLKKTAYSLSGDYYSDNYYASFEFEGEGKEYSYSYYTLNAKTGEITNYRSGKELPNDSKAKITESASNKLIDETVKGLSGNKFSEYKPDEAEGFSKRYTRYVNGIPTEDYITASVNEFTGKPERYSISYSEIEFPDIKDVISPDNAADTLFSQIEYLPSYVISGNKGYAVYMMVSPISVALNPFSGKLITYGNKEYEENGIIAYKDISGHWAEGIINSLSKYGIGFYEENFYPDKAITKKEYIALISSAFLSGQPIILKNDEEHTDEISRAIRNGIILNDENTEGNLTREESAIYMIRALGIEEYAALSSIFIKPFQDVDKNNGYIAILSGLNIIKGDSSGNFNPEKELTRAEAMVMIYNYLSR